MTRQGPSGTLRGVLALIDARTLASDELLGRYLNDRDEVAFRALVERYAGLVARRCRATLGRDDQVEDAFQETFLRLATHGHAVRRAGRVGAWLAVTAARVGAELRVAADRRRGHEMAAGADPDRTPPADPAEVTSDADLGAAVLAELARLPDRYRLPLECVYLDGMTHAEAARALGLPKGTVDAAVARGLKRLRAAAGKLGLVGPVVAAGGLERVLSAEARAAPPGWVAAAVRAAAAADPRPAGLVEVVRAIAATRSVGLGGAVLLAGCLGVGLVLAARPAPAEADPRPPAARPAPASTPAEPVADRNRRVLEADTLPRVLEALKPLALNGGSVRVTQLAAYDTRAWFEVEARHNGAPAGVAATRLRVFFDTRTHSSIVHIDEWGTGRFHQVVLDRPIVLFRVPELGIETVLRSRPLERAVAALRAFPTDPRADAAAAAHRAAVGRALAPYRGVWHLRGDRGRPAVCAIPPGDGADDEFTMPNGAGTVPLRAHELEVDAAGRVRIWWDRDWYELTDGGRRLRLGTDQWWNRAPETP